MDLGVSISVTALQLRPSKPVNVPSALFSLAHFLANALPFASCDPIHPFASRREIEYTVLDLSIRSVVPTSRGRVSKRGGRVIWVRVSNSKQVLLFTTRRTTLAIYETSCRGCEVSQWQDDSIELSG